MKRAKKILSVGSYFEGGFVKCSWLWEYIEARTNTEKNNGILLPKLFWPTVRKIVLVIEKNISNSRLKDENLQKFWDH